MDAQAGHPERLSTGTKLAYGAPVFASAALSIPIAVHMTRFSADVVLVPLGALGVAIALARAFDAVTDPLMGWLSDRTRTRWGRPASASLALCVAAGGAGLARRFSAAAKPGVAVVVAVLLAGPGFAGSTACAGGPRAAWPARGCRSARSRREAWRRRALPAKPDPRRGRDLQARHRS